MLVMHINVCKLQTHALDCRPGLLALCQWLRIHVYKVDAPKEARYLQSKVPLSCKLGEVI